MWFTHVVGRVAHGDVLYHDVFFGAPPLSVYVALPLVLAFGTHLLVVKALVICCEIGSVLLALRTARQLGVVRRNLLGLALVVGIAPAAISLYQPLATFAAMGSFSLALTWLERHRGGRPEFAALAGSAACAGLATVAKQNLGVLIFAALLVVVVLETRGLRHLRRRVATAAAAFAIPVLAVLAPMLATGARSEFFDYVVVKRRYLANGTVVLGLTPSAVGDLLKHPSLFNAGTAYLGLQLLVPALAGVIVVAALARGRRKDRKFVAATVFAAAFAGTLFPWTSLWHVELVLPGIVPAVAAGLHALRPKSRSARGATLALGAWLALGLIPTVVVPAIDFAQGDLRFSRLPSIEGAILTPRIEATLRRNVARLRMAEHGRPLFLLVQGASFYYEAAEVKNPTAFDFPASSSFGSHGERGLVRRLDRGDLRTVCLGPFTFEAALQPQLLLRYVRTEMRASRDLGPCVLYTRR